MVLAASYEAKAYGVRTPMGHVQALRLCPQAIVVSPRMEIYSEASKAMFGVFNDTTPFVEGLSIDEAFLEVGGLRRISGTPTEIAVRLRREVLEKVGLPILEMLERSEDPSISELTDTMEVVTMHERYHTPEQLSQLEARR